MRESDLPLTSDHVAKKSKPPAMLFKGEQASEDCASASKAKSRVSFAISAMTLRRIESTETLLAPDVGSGVTIRSVNLASSAMGSLGALVSGKRMSLRHKIR